MALLTKPKGQKADKKLLARINQGRERLETFAPRNDECWEFYRGNHYAYVDERNVLQVLPTTVSTRGTGKPAHRARQARNLIFDAVLRIVSQATQQIPSYQVVPSTEDPDDVSAARLAEKVLIFGHDRWNVRDAAVKAVTHSIVNHTGEAFAWVYFDNQVPPFITGESVGLGDVRIRIYGANECYWESGIQFEDSPWHAIDQAMTMAEARNLDGFIEGTELVPDASTRQLSHRGRLSSDKPNLVLVTHYLERPTPQKPEGCWKTLANGLEICEERPYPGDGQDPCLRKLSFAIDADNDRDLGLVSQAIDAMRTRNDADNKLTEWKNHALMPRLFVSPGLMKKQRFTDEPGKVYEIPQPDQNVKFLEVPTVPKELFEMTDRATADIGRIFANDDIPPQIEAARAIEAWLESNRSRHVAFFGNLATWYAQIAHDCLVQVQQHYSEPRLLQIKGDFGWESIKDFRGAQLRNQVDVRVSADSIMPQTKQAVEQRVMMYAQAGWVSGEEAMTAIETGTADRLVRSVANDEARAGRVIQRIKEGPEALYSMPNLPTGEMVKEPVLDPVTGEPIIDPMTGQPMMQPTDQLEMAPGWMPRRSDNLGVWKVMFSNWMKTEEFEMLDPEMQQAAAAIFGGILQLEAQIAQEQQNAMAAEAEQLGMQNAAKPQVKPLPSLSGAGEDEGNGPPFT